MKADIANQRSYLANEDMSRLPEEAGVYFLYQKGNILVYIGKATSVKNRILQHDKEKEFVRIGYELTHISRARTREKELLQLYLDEHGQLPYYNRQR